MNPDHSDPKKHVPSVQFGDDLSTDIIDATSADFSFASESDAVRASGVEPSSHGERALIPSALNRGSKHLNVKEIAPQRSGESRKPMTPLIISKTTKNHASGEVRKRVRKNRSADALSTGVTNTRATLLWIICAGSAVILIVVGAIFLHSPPKDAAEIILSDSPYKYLEDAEKESNSKESGIFEELVNGKNQAMSLFTKYATSSSVEDFIDIVYLSDKNRESISKFWKPMGIKPGWKPSAKSRWQILENNGIQHGLLAVELPNLELFMAVFRQEEGILKMDWKASVAHSSASFYDLKQGQGDANEIRAIVSPGNFYTHLLPDSEFRCYKLVASDNQESVWAYVKINSDIDSELIAQFTPSQLTGEARRFIPVVLLLERGSAESMPSQWMISKVLRLDWLDE